MPNCPLFFIDLVDVEDVKDPAMTASSLLMDEEPRLEQYLPSSL